MKYIRLKDGMQGCELSGWAEFTEFVGRVLDYRHFVWRGQREETWTLEPTLDRVLRRRVKLNSTIGRKSHLERFRYAIRGRRGPNPAPVNSENEWWALGQHHGLNTPLLDWTRSPYAAAFFAYESPEISTTRRRVVFGISQTTFESKSKEISRGHSGNTRPPIVEFIEPLSDDNPRLVAQRGLFTRAPDGVDIEQWTSTNFRDDTEKVRMYKIFLPDPDRETTLRSLNRMNINHLTLFPDLSGASLFANIDLDIDMY